MDRWEKIKCCRDAGSVKRFHVFPTLGTQTVGQHSWDVALLVQYIDPDCRKEVLLEALYHDIPEIFTGDVPAPTKWDHPDLAVALDAAEAYYANLLDLNIELTEEERRLVKIADMLDLVFYAYEQIKFGNQNAELLFVRGVKHLRDKYDLPMKVIEVISKMEQSL